MKKKILMAAIAAMVNAGGAWAQLEIVGNVDVKKECTLQAEWNWLYSTGGVYYYVTKTDNRFDDNVWIRLGDDAGSVTATCEDLLALIENKAKGVIVKDADGRGVLLNFGSSLGVKHLRVAADGRAGTGYIYKSSLEKIIRRMGNAAEN